MLRCPLTCADGSLEHEDEIQRAMIAGNYEAAVESCFKANRLADALLIANIFNRQVEGGQAEGRRRGWM